jgi:hypothetical protein
VEQAAATNTASDGNSLPGAATAALSIQDQKIYYFLGLNCPNMTTIEFSK